MATAVLDFEFECLPREMTGLERYSQALVLIRFRGQPVGQAMLPVVDGRIEDLRTELMCAADSAFWEHWLRNYLGMKEERVNKLVGIPATVAVCTRDRPEDMQRCIEALFRLHDDGQELLVIDNCPSTEATRRVVEGHPGIRYVRENRPGLDIARNRALREAKHDIIAFTDDDAAPDPGWLRSLLRNFDNPSVLCVTGQTMAIELEAEAQECYQSLGGLGRGFKRMVFDSAYHDPLDGWRAGAGVNMAVRRSILELVGPFDEGLDVGTPVRGGGDSDIFRRILAAGYRIVYDPEALNWHRHRTSWKALRRQLYGYESAGFAIWARSFLVDGEFGALKHAWDWFHRELPGLGRSILQRPGSTPLDLMAARFRGAAVGPWAYLYARYLLWKSEPR